MFSYKNNKYIIINYIILLIFIPIINASLDLEEIKNIKKWDEETLFEYIKTYYINKENIEDFHYMIVDPNQYLKDKNLINIKNSFEQLHNEYNVTSFIYIINYLKKNTDLNYKLKDFNNKIFSEIKLNNQLFEEYSTLSIIFQVEDNKMNVRLGSSCRSIISDSEAYQILKDNEKYLSSKQIDIILGKFINSFLKKYKHNYIKYKKEGNSFSFLRKILTFKGIFILSIIILSYFLLIYFCLIYKIDNQSTKKVEPLTELEKEIENFIKINKNENIEIIMKTSCIICMNNYESEILSSDDKNSLPCGHIFHNQCIYKYFKLKENNHRCPICKAKFIIKLNEKKEKVSIKDFSLNDKWDYNNNNNFVYLIDDFINIQKMMNPFEVKDEFCNKIKFMHDKQNLEGTIAKIKNF